MVVTVRAARDRQWPWNGSSLSSGIRTGIVKVPEVTVYFWIVKLLTTAMARRSPITW